MTKIHPLAVVDSRAELGRDVEIGPFCVVEAGVKLGDGCVLHGHATIHSGTELGRNNRVYHGAVLGGLPQHVRAPTQAGHVRIGDGNTFREHVTVHRALQEGHATHIGDNNYFMVNAHVAHDCHVGNHCILVNNVAIGGHVTVEDRAILSGGTLVHQFCRVGKLAIMGGMCRGYADVPPFVTVDGNTSLIVGLNLIGLRRAGYTTAEIAQLKQAYRLIYRSGLRWTEILERLATEFPTGPATEFTRFFTTGGKRGFIPARRGAVGSTWEVRDDEDELPPAALAG